MITTMDIPINFLQNYLRDVYFFCGTACGGKTTISRAFAEKHGFQWLREDVINDQYQALAEPEYQPAQYDRPTDWTKHLLRPVDEYWRWLTRISEEQAPLMLLESIRLSGVKPVVVDCAVSLRIVFEVCPPDRVVFLVTDAERAARENLDRPDHQDLNKFIESLPRANEIKENIHKLFVYGNAQSLDKIQHSGRFCIVRDDNSSIDQTLMEIEKHFGFSA